MLIPAQGARRGEQSVKRENKKKNTTQWLDRIAAFGMATAAGIIIYRH